jgi:hypothetical protein
MARARSTFGKLQRDQAKKDRARAKMDDRSRAGGQGGGDLEQAAPSRTADEVDQTRLLEQFAALHEDLADGRISLDDFEVRQEELRAKMVVDRSPFRPAGRVRRGDCSGPVPASRPSSQRRNPGRVGVDAVHDVRASPCAPRRCRQERVEAG